MKPAVMAIPKFCSLCGRPLGGSGALLKPRGENERGLALCHNCLRSASRCPACQALLPADHAGRCPACGAEWVRCRLCGQITAGRHVQASGSDLLCETCRHVQPACTACGSPVVDGGRILTGDHLICPACERTIVYDEPAARAQFDQVKAAIGRELGLSLNVPTPVYLVDRDQLAAVARRLDKIIEPLPLDRSLGVYLRQGRRRGIYVLLGLPQALLSRRVAHLGGIRRVGGLQDFARHRARRYFTPHARPRRRVRRWSAPDA
jgi:hypothetical protein